LFWSFRSPYSYLVTPRLLEFERELDVKAAVRPVYPIAMRIDGLSVSWVALLVSAALAVWGAMLLRR